MDKSIGESEIKICQEIALKLEMRGVKFHPATAHRIPQRFLIDSSITNESGVIEPSRIHDVLAD